MKRRKFMAILAAAAVVPARGLRASPAKKKVLVLGAGLAGLTASLELVRAGHDVTVLEASDRPGGRVRTLREPFAAGLHAEAGATFVAKSHDLVLRYARAFGLTLDPAFPLFDARLYYVRGRHVVDGGEWPFALTPEERKLGRRGLWARYIGEALPLLDGKAAPLAPIDAVSAAEFLRSRGASPEAVALLRVGDLDLLGEGIESYSALEMLERAEHTREAQSHYYRIRGGSESLVRGFAEALAGRIRYGAAVVRIEPGERTAGVVVQANGTRERLRADHVVCAVPFSLLRSVEVQPAFSAQKRKAIDTLAYTSVTRVFLQFDERPWARENSYVVTSTDLPFQRLTEHTVGEPGSRAILAAEAVGLEAERLGRMPEAERIRAALSCVEQVFPGAARHYERGASICWQSEPWARGAFSYFRPGQMLALRPQLASVEGRVHFAGDHTSAWSGWMQGAIESGLRAAAEVGAA